MPCGSHDRSLIALANIALANIALANMLASGERQTVVEGGADRGCFTPQGLSATEACCTCGGGYRASSETIVVKTRDPLADSETWISNTGPDYTAKPGGTEAAQHTTAIYEPPDEDWWT